MYIKVFILNKGIVICGIWKILFNINLFYIFIFYFLMVWIEVKVKKEISIKVLEYKEVFKNGDIVNWVFLWWMY